MHTRRERGRRSGRPVARAALRRLRRGVPQAVARQLFSFNNPIGACEACRGFGRTIGVDSDKVLERGKTIEQGGVRPWAGKAAEHERKLLMRHCKRAGIPTDVPIAKLSTKQTRR